MSDRSSRVIHRALLAGAGAVMAACLSQAASDKAREGMVSKGDLEIVDCLLPGEVRRLGGTSFISRRRPTRTTASDCHIRGGEYTPYDRADYKSALKVWMDQAKDDDPDAQTNVGEIYERGLGGEPNYEAAIIWYQKAIDNKKASEAAKARAYFNLGTLYEQGKGVEKDRLHALNLYRHAWGLPEDDLIYKSAKDREVGSMRAELEQTIGQKQSQLDLMTKQLADLKQKSSADAATMQQLVDRLAAERAQTQKLLDALPPAPPKLAAAPAGTADEKVRSPRGSETMSGGAPQAGLTVNHVDFGRYFALIVGNQNYEHLESLSTPRYDAERAAKILSSQYGFTVKTIEDGNDVAILKALNDLNKELGPNDNLLIYYAGHGYRLKAQQSESGFWLPRNADQPPNDTFWVPNEQISSHIGRMAAKRVLVVADSCYAGLLSSDPNLLLLDKPTELTQQYIAYKVKGRSRLLIASGGDKPVLDSGGQGNSVFAKAFLDALEANKNIMSAPGLFSQVQGRVKEGALRNHFSEEPEMKSIGAAGHEGGDFFFVPVNRTGS